MRPTSAANIFRTGSRRWPRFFSHPGHEGFEAYFVFYDNLYDRLGAPEELREKINRGTAIRLFELE